MVTKWVEDRCLTFCVFLLSGTGLFSHRSAAARKSTILKRSEGSKLIQCAGGPLGLSRYRQHLRDSGCTPSRRAHLLERSNAPSLNTFVEKHGTTVSVVIRDAVGRPRHRLNRTDPAIHRPSHLSLCLKGLPPWPPTGTRTDPSNDSTSTYETPDSDAPPSTPRPMPWTGY